jgi:hypothetical protein
VREQGGVLRLGAEPGPERGVAGVLVAEDLHRDRAVEELVVPPPHLAHAAAGDQ